MLTKISGQEEGLRPWGPFPEQEPVVGLPVDTHSLVAEREAIEAALCLLQQVELLLEQLIPSNTAHRTEASLLMITNGTMYSH